MSDVVMPFMSSDDMELLSSPSSRPGAPHRRVRSDPSDVMQALRAERQSWGGLSEIAPAPKRDLSPLMDGSGFSPAFKKHAPGRAPHLEDGSRALGHFPATGLFSGPGLDSDLTAAAYDPEMVLDGPADSVDAAAGKGGSKKDVPMWTVEEDLLILQLVEKHGKRWSKIAAHLPGRTDNGVRNRWNRMERAQVLRQRRGPEAGYRCRRCGQPKRGHICAALTLGDTPAGEELQQKAAALSQLSAHRMRPPSATSEPASISEPPLSAQSTPRLAPERSPSPELPLLQWGAAGVVKRDPEEMQSTSATGLQCTSATGPQADMTAETDLPLKSAAAPAPAQVPDFADFQLDDFLDELQLHEFVKPAPQPTGAAAGMQFQEAPAAAPALLSQASLNSLLMTLSMPEQPTGFSPMYTHTSPAIF